MVIPYLHFRTKNGEVITLRNITAIHIGVRDSKLYLENEGVLVVETPKGTIEFNTNELEVLNFFIVDEESNTVLPVFSHELGIFKTEKGEEGCKDTKDAQ